MVKKINLAGSHFSMLVVLGALYCAPAQSHTKTNDIQVNQLPDACENYYQTLSDKPYAILPCFAPTLGNNRTNQSAIRDAYRQFHALNWPLSDSTIGMADYQLDYSQQLDTYPVWQSWPTVAQMKSGDITKWQQTSYKLPLSCQSLFTKNNQGTSQYTQFISNYPTVPRGPKIEVLSNSINPEGETIADVNGQPVYYQVYLNQPAFAYLTSQQRPINSLNFPAGQVNADKRGAIYIKAAWKVLTDNELNQYHSSFAVVIDGDSKNAKQCRLAVVGLSAQHIVSKNNPKNQPNSSDANKWSWATYLNAASMPRYSEANNGDYQLSQQDILPPNDGWAFFNKSLNELKKQCINNQDQWDEVLDTCPINKNNCEIGSKCTGNTLVAYPITQDKANLDTYNAQTKKHLPSSVWRNYQILNNQWLDRGFAAPEILENPVLEPFFHNKSSCSSCHSDANKQVFKDYIFSPGVDMRQLHDLSNLHKGIK